MSRPLLLQIATYRATQPTLTKPPVQPLQSQTQVDPNHGSAAFNYAYLRCMGRQKNSPSRRPYSALLMRDLRQMPHCYWYSWWTLSGVRMIFREGRSFMSLIIAILLCRGVWIGWVVSYAVHCREEYKSLSDTCSALTLFILPSFYFPSSFRLPPQKENETKC